VIEARRFEVAEHLGDVFVGEIFGCLELDEQTVLNNQVGEVFADDRAILVMNLDGLLLLDGKTREAETVNQPFS